MFTLAPVFSSKAAAASEITLAWGSPEDHMDHMVRVTPSYSLPAGAGSLLSSAGWEAGGLLAGGSLLGASALLPHPASMDRTMTLASNRLVSFFIFILYLLK